LRRQHLQIASRPLHVRVGNHFFCRLLFGSAARLRCFDQRRVVRASCDCGEKHHNECCCFHGVDVPALPYRSSSLTTSSSSGVETSATSVSSAASIRWIRRGGI